MAFTEVYIPSYSVTGSNLMLLDVWWCSPQPTLFPSLVHYKDAGNCTSLILLAGYPKGYGHRARDPQHSPENALSSSLGVLLEEKSSQRRNYRA